ncbi:phosphopantetheine-binding protein, partial [Rhizobium leguminosarum]|uniref:phosphopantetheine-binding protein n=1 Tax=Rhizobium leguminosarum TaxID=384 RepID=UPI003F9DC021
IWAEVLRVEKVGIHDNFFELGGHSLLATRVIARIRESLKVDIPFRVLLESQSIQELTNRLVDLRQKPTGTRIPALVSQPRFGPPPLSFAQERLWFLEQLQSLGSAYHEG